jgi:putative transposase
MVRPAARRQAVEYVQTTYQLSERSSCRALGMPRATQRYRSRKESPDPMLVRLRALATLRPRAGYRTLGRLLRREGTRINDKRVHRLYRSEGLSLRVKRRRRHAASARVVPQPAVRPWQRWAMDFMSESTTDGHRFRSSRSSTSSPAEPLASSSSAASVAAASPGFSTRWQQCTATPDSINIDNGPEFVSKALDQWAHAHGVTLYFSRPGKPVDNAFIESFNGRLRDECLNTNWFYGLEQARDVIGAWLKDYNEHRPHSSLAGLTPVEYEMQVRTSRVD